MLPHSSVLLIVIDGGLKIWYQKIFSQFMVVVWFLVCFFVFVFLFLLNVVNSYFIQTGEK